MSIMKIKQVNKSAVTSRGMMMTVCGYYPVEEFITGLTFKAVIYSDGGYTYNQQCTCKRLTLVQLCSAFIV